MAINLILLVILVNSYVLKLVITRAHQSFYITYSELQLSNLKEKFKAINDADALSKYIREWHKQINTSLPDGKGQIKKQNNKVYIKINWILNHNNYEKNLWFNID